jgi:hypothetical protein
MDIVKAGTTHQKTTHEEMSNMNKTILSTALFLVLLAFAISVVSAPTLAKKSSESLAGYRDGAVDGQKAADALNAGKSSGVDANNPPPCPSTDPNYCKSYKKGFSDQAVSALE